MAITSMFGKNSMLGKKVAAATLAVLTLGAGVTMNAGDAEARFGRKGLIAAGIVGALVTGAIVASSRNAHAGYDDGYDAGYAPAPAYHQPQQVYYRQPQHYGHQYGQPDHRYGYQYAPRDHRYGYGYEHRPRYGRNRPGYSETGFAYKGPVCKIRKQQVWTPYGVQVQRVQVCN